MTQEQFPRNSFIPPHQSGLPVHRTKRTPTGFVPVTQWDGLLNLSQQDLMAVLPDMRDN